MFDLLVLHYFKVLSTDLAVDGVAEVLLGHPDQAAADQDGHGDPVVQLEDHIVDGELVGLEDPLGRAQQVQRHPPRSHTVTSTSRSLSNHGHCMILLIYLEKVPTNSSFLQNL